VRNTYLVCYDVSNDLRLRKVHKTMRGFGDHLQYSVFECQLTRTDLARCRHLLSEIIHHREDQMLFVDLGPVEGRGERVISAVGRPYTPIDSPCIVVEHDDESGRPVGPLRKQNVIQRAREERARRELESREEDGRAPIPHPPGSASRHVPFRRRPSFGGRSLCRSICRHGC